MSENEVLILFSTIVNYKIELSVQKQNHRLCPFGLNNIYLWCPIKYYGSEKIIREVFIRKS
jgi:hypothetical protein